MTPRVPSPPFLWHGGDVPSPPLLGLLPKGGQQPCASPRDCDKHCSRPLMFNEVCLPINVPPPGCLLPEPDARRTAHQAPWGTVRVPRGAPAASTAHPKGASLGGEVLSWGHLHAMIVGWSLLHWGSSGGALRADAGMDPQSSAAVGTLALVGAWLLRGISPSKWLLAEGCTAR